MEIKDLSQKAEAMRRQLAANDKAAKSSKLFLQCFCTHRDDNGDYIIDPGINKKSQYSNAPLYRCKRCGVDIDLTVVNQEELDKAMDSINRVIHMSKMAIRMNTPEDKKLMERIMKLQLKLNNVVPGLARTLGKGGNRKNNQKRNNSMVEIGRR